MLVILVPGSFRLGWFGRLVNVPSNFRVAVSARRKFLPRPIERFTVPGPTSVPTPALPKRPIGATLQLNWSLVPAICPGQTNAARLKNMSAVGLERLPSATASGRWVPRAGALVPEGSPPLMVAVRYGPVCSRRIPLMCHPPAIASTAEDHELP